MEFVQRVAAAQWMRTISCKAHDTRSIAAAKRSSFPYLVVVRIKHLGVFFGEVLRRHGALIVTAV